MNIGSVIRIKREEAGLTQQKLGELLFVSRQSVSRWESGSRTPDLAMLKKIASVLKISNDELLIFADEGVIYNARGNNDKIRIFAGFDCGGSNTRCMLVSEEGAVLGVGRGGPSNYSFCGKLVAAESIRQSIREAFADAKMQPSKISGIFIASAAVEVFCGGEHEEFFKEVTGCKNVICNSDIFPVWYAGSRFEPAAAMIAGTGAVAYFLDGESFTKASGWGPQFGDEGSGYYIGINSIRAAARMADRRTPMDESFYKTVISHFGVSEADPLELSYVVNRGDHRKLVASLTKEILRLCDDKNAVALDIVSDAADELALALRALSEQTDCEFSLLLSGGLLQNDTPLRRMLIKKAKAVKGIKGIVALSCDPVYASAAIALRYNGLPDAAEILMSCVKGVERL